MKLYKLICLIFSSFLIIIFINYLFFGIVNLSPVSPDYNVDLARNILSGEFLNTTSSNPFMYFPASSHFILAIFLIIGFPNLFGLFSYIFLFVLCKKLGEIFNLKPYISFIYAASFSTTISVIRTVNDQSIDKWLCAWFILSIIFLEKIKPTWKSAILIGFSLGMLLGTKYSGPLFFLALLPIYTPTLLRNLNLERFSLLLITTYITGGFWYIRNFFLHDNFFYPANILFFRGVEGYTQQDWYLWKIPLEYPEGFIPLLNAFLSEYLLWTVSSVVITIFIIRALKNKFQINRNIKKVVGLSITTGIASLFLPITPAYRIDLFHIISDMRYIYIFVVFTMLATFLIANKLKKTLQLSILALLNTAIMFSFIPYQPKIFIFCITLIAYIYYWNPKIKNLWNKVLGFK